MQFQTFKTHSLAKQCQCDSRHAGLANKRWEPATATAAEAHSEQISLADLLKKMRLAVIKSKLVAVLYQLDKSYRPSVHLRTVIILTAKRNSDHVGINFTGNFHVRNC